MRKYLLCFLLLFPIHNALAQPQTGAPAQPAEIRIEGAPLPARVLVQSPAETAAELQIICLFVSAPQNQLHGSLAEIDGKLHGLLDQIRKPTLFRGELGETLLIKPPAGTLRAQRLLIIGLGDSESFTPDRMELVGSIAFREASRLGIAHPFFAPTILDGGVTKYTTGEVAEHFIRGFLQAAKTEEILTKGHAAAAARVEEIAYLAGPAHAADTQQGIEKAFAAAQ